MTRPLTPEAQSILDAFNDAPIMPPGTPSESTLTYDPTDRAALAAALYALANQSKTYQIHSPDNRDPWTDEITAITADDILTIADELDHAI